MKTCPICNELHGDSVERCYKCNHSFAKKFFCSKCNKPLDSETSSCECGGWAVSPITYNGGNLDIDWTREELKSKAKARLKTMLLLAIVACLLISPFLYIRSNITHPTPQGAVYSLLNNKGDTISYYYNDKMHSYDTVDDFISAPAKLKLTIGWWVVTVMKDPNPWHLRYVTYFSAFVSLLISIFLLNPYEVGLNRFFMTDIYGKTNLKSVLYAFSDSHYGTIVKKMFFMKFKIFLWTLLLIIPGIIKTLEYAMVPYLLSENPDITMEEAYRISSTMMYGNKWEVFVLELSFILWDILTLLTLNLASVVWVTPYKQATYAQLYDKFRCYRLGNKLETSEDLPGYES